MPEVLVPLGMMAGAAMGEWLSNRRSGGEFSRVWSQDSEEPDSKASSQRSSTDDESGDGPALREIPSCIRPGLFIGSVAAERDLNVLQALGITHVLQVGLSLRPRHWENLKYSLVKAADSRTFDIFHAMIKCNAFDFIEKGRRAGGVLVHCAAGRSRSAAVVCAYLMHKEGLECEEAIRDLCETHWICPNVGFKEQLQLFEDLGGDIARWPNPTDPAWPKKISRRSAMELDRPSMREVRPVRAPSAAQPSQEPLTKSTSLPELAAPQQPAETPAETTQASQPDRAPEPEPRMRQSISADDLQSQCSAKQAQSNQIIQELVEVLDMHQDKPSSQETAKKPEQKPEQANKWLAFQKLVSQQAAEEAALQKKTATAAKKAGPPARVPAVPKSAPQRAVSPPRSSSAPSRRPSAMCQTPMRPPSNNRRSRRVRPQVPANSVFLPPGVWQQSDQGRDPNWDLRKALEAAGLNKPTQEGAVMTRRYSFDNSPPPAPALVKVF